jgi:putative hydrolase of the HAD superfamily
LGEYFSRIEIVREKDRAAYEKILIRQRIDPRRFLMVGNSIKSDILPVVEIGGRAVYIPYQTTWIHERVSERDLEGRHYIELRHISLLPDLLRELGSGR